MDTPESDTMCLSDKVGGSLRVQVTSSNLAAAALPSPLMTGESTPLLAVGSGVRGSNGTRMSLSSSLKPRSEESPTRTEGEESPGALEDRGWKHSPKPASSPLGLLEELTTPVGTAFRSLRVLFRSPRCSREESGSEDAATISPQPHPLADTPRVAISRAVGTCWEQIMNRLPKSPDSLSKAAEETRQELCDKASHTRARLSRKGAAVRESFASLKKQGKELKEAATELKEAVVPTPGRRDGFSGDFLAGFVALLGGVLSTVPSMYPEAPEDLAFWGNMLSTLGCLMTLRHGIISDMHGQYEIWCATEARFEDKSEPPTMCIMNYLKSFMCKMKCHLESSKNLHGHDTHVQAHLSLVREKVHLGAFCALFTQLLSDVVSIFEVPAMTNFLHSPIGMVVYWFPYLCCAGLGNFRTPLLCHSPDAGTPSLSLAFSPIALMGLLVQRDFRILGFCSSNALLASTELCAPRRPSRALSFLERLMSAVLCWLENCEECTGDECILEYPQEVGVPASDTSAGVWDFYDCGDGEWVGGDDDWWPETDGTLDGYVDDMAEAYPIPLTAGEEKKELKESTASPVAGDAVATAPSVEAMVDVQKLSDYMNIIGSVEFMVYSMEQFAENVDQMLSSNTSHSAAVHSHSVYTIFLAMQHECSLLVHMMPPSLLHHGGVFLIPMFKILRILVSKSYFIGLIMMNTSSLLAVLQAAQEQEQVSDEAMKKQRNGNDSAEKSKKERLLSGRISLTILQNLALKLKNGNRRD
ncbi:hypothetical protein CYMTET_10863 [Cymbomonas tetramitiformis]|uniref:Uncharacterized protein n=1 Tax=Cymbomonas tetramitiformis TaxID=36881 RepID=A0AAE0GNH5_9CHLO|nr:hypothetical protein CYMTET_10863 [Cymbomonas tetramitiformis]